MMFRKVISFIYEKILFGDRVPLKCMLQIACYQLHVAHCMLQIAQTKTKATHTHKTHTHKVTLSLFELLVATKNKTTSIHTSIHAYNVTSSLLELLVVPKNGTIWLSEHGEYFSFHLEHSDLKKFLWLGKPSKKNVKLGLLAETPLTQGCLTWGGDGGDPAQCCQKRILPKLNECLLNAHHFLIEMRTFCLPFKHGMPTFSYEY